MNKTNELFGAIKSHDFSAIVNLASNFKTLLHILECEKAVQDLGAAMEDREVQTAVAERALVLVQDQGKEGYEHPADSALATYLWLLAGKNAPAARAVAAKIAVTPRCWWAHKMAEKVLGTDQVPSRSG